jgi:hypothetical protein
MIDWACNSDVLISFDREPVIQVRVIKPYMTPLEKRSISKYPFCCKKPLKVMIFDNKKFKQYNFSIKENYCYDGASIPRMFWRLIGSNTSAEFLIPSLIHDVLCENHNYIDNDRELSSKVFKALLLAAGVSEIKAEIMYNAVNIFQSLFCDWGLEYNK